jgi:pyruvate/2-oxoglutarate dehydrogenase complex dihydrolipoamide dehydrogenase (E3) component
MAARDSAHNAARDYDLIVIGAGAVGENVADYATQSGLSVVIVESELVGGECSYWACMPSKALLRASSVLRAARAVEGAAQAVTGGVDPAGVFARRTRIIHDWNDEGQVEWLKGAHIDLVRGHGRLTGERAVSVTTPEGDTVELRARHAVTISTGSAALLPDIPGLAGIEPWTSRDATSAKSAPASLAILGGGVVGAEMATAYASFGTKVTMIVRGGLLGGQEPFAAELVQASLEKAGVTIRSGVELVSAHRTGSDKAPANAVLELSDGSKVVAEQVLVAVGRTPRTGDLGLETVGLTSGDWLTVDDTMRVEGYDWLYATGDVNHRVLLTHQGKYQARAAGQVIATRAKGQSVDDAKWGRHVASADAEAVPQVTFTDPEVASVGLTAAAAKKAGYSIRVVDYDMSWLAGATVHSDDYVGQARAIVDEDRKVLLGVTFVGPDVGELLQAATIAVVGEVPIDRLWHAVPAYPTVNEIWLRLLETYGR